MWRGRARSALYVRTDTVFAPPTVGQNELEPLDGNPTVIMDSWPAIVSRRILRNERAPRLARMMAREQLGDLSPEVLDDILVVLTELVTNAVRHGEEPVHFEIQRRDRRIRVVVSDGATGIPAFPAEPGNGERGRGLLIVDAIAQDWGVQPGSGGKTVWAILAAD